MKDGRRWCAAVVVVLWMLVPAPAVAQTIDHGNLPAFDALTLAQVADASALRMLFVNRSVGHNINTGLNCLTYTYDEAPSACKRWQHPAPEFAVTESLIRWNGRYLRPHWSYGSWPGTGIPNEISCASNAGGLWFDLLRCFIEYIDDNPHAYDVVSFQFSYLEVAAHSDITHPERGFFGTNPPQGRATVADLEALRARHPHLIFVLQTTSLARSIGTAVSRDFNAHLRNYAAAHNWPLLDVAAILSHDPWGRPCFDNRDGIPYTVNGQLREDYPNDGHDLPAICQHYTSEVNGGHLGSPSAGMLRAAKGWWVLLASLAGSGAPEPPPPPPPSAPEGPPVLSPLTCTVEGRRITCTATFDGDASAGSAVLAIRNAAGQTANSSTQFIIR